MAHTDILPDNVLDSIAEQIGFQMSNLLPQEALSDGAAGMAETFSLWLLEANSILQPTNELSAVAKSTGRWHHQLKVGSKMSAYARSIPLGLDNWSVREIFQSEIAERLDRAIGWIDQNVQDDPLVRLLTIPAYQIYALWLVSEHKSQVLPVVFPSQFTSLRDDHLLSSEEFLNILRREQPVIGIITR